MKIYNLCSKSDLVWRLVSRLEPAHEPERARSELHLQAHNVTEPSSARLVSSPRDTLPFVDGSFPFCWALVLSRLIWYGASKLSCDTNLELSSKFIRALLPTSLESSSPHAPLRLIAKSTPYVIYLEVSFVGLIVEALIGRFKQHNIIYLTLPSHVQSDYTCRLKRVIFRLLVNHRSFWGCLVGCLGPWVDLSKPWASVW